MSRFKTRGLIATVRDVRGNKQRADYMNLKCVKAKNWLRDVLKDISSSEHTKTHLQDGNKGVSTQYNFHRHNICQPFNSISSLFPCHVSSQAIAVQEQTTERSTGS